MHPTSLVEAVDSAYRTGWQLWDSTHVDTLRHTAFYDSVLRYVHAAVGIEREKRLWTARLQQADLLNVEKLQNSRQRDKGLALLEQHRENDTVWHARLDTLMTNYTRFIKRTADTLYRDDESARGTFMTGAMRSDLFVPVWRPSIDSVEASLVDAHRGMIVFFDTIGNRATFDDRVRFRDESALAQYDSLRRTIETLSQKEIEGMSRVQDRKPE